MAHDASKVLMGAHGSSDFVANNEDGSPLTFIAGLAVRRTSANVLSLSSGSLIGISMGRSNSETAKTSVCRSGNLIPIQLTDETDEEEEIGAFDYVVVGAAVEVSATTGKAVSDDVATGAIYVSGPIKGIAEDGSEIDVALVDMGGGL